MPYCKNFPDFCKNFPGSNATLLPWFFWLWSKPHSLLCSSGCPVSTKLIREIPLDGHWRWFSWFCFDRHNDSKGCILLMIIWKNCFFLRVNDEENVILFIDLHHLFSITCKSKYPNLLSSWISDFINITFIIIIIFFIIEVSKQSLGWLLVHFRFTRPTSLTHHHHHHFHHYPHNNHQISNAFFSFSFCPVLILGHP